MPAAFGPKLVQQTSGNFAKAYAKACAEGLIKKKPLVTAKGANAGRLFLHNAPEANVASIYLDGGRMLLEYPFVSADRKAHVPTTDELHEAIFCAVHGASEKEQEESGRCLPD
jgi:putative methionine-R-sulfoxide reductase with GAF domain